VNKALVFMASWQVCTKWIRLGCAMATANQPYGGSMAGAYLAVLNINNTLATFLSNVIFVSRFKEKMREALPWIFKDTTKTIVVSIVPPLAG